VDEPRIASTQPHSGRNWRAGGVLWLLSLLLLTLIQPSTSQAATDLPYGCANSEADRWDGGVGTTNWNDPTNWVDDTVPGAQDNVCLDLDGDITVNYSSTALGGPEVRSIENRENLILSGGELSPSGVFDVKDLGTLTISGGTLSGDGTADIHGDAFLTGGGFEGTGSIDFHEDTTIDGPISISGWDFTNSGNLHGRAAT
jgi:hypothetical protein